MIDRKRGVVDQTSGGINFLMKKNKIDVLTGLGSFKDKNTIVITPEGGKSFEIKTKNTIIATGSKPSSFPFIKLDKKREFPSDFDQPLHLSSQDLNIVSNAAESLWATRKHSLCLFGNNLLQSCFSVG